MALEIYAYKCKKCGQLHYPFRMVCKKCGKNDFFEFDTVPLPKKGKLLTFTTVYNLPPDFNVAKLGLGIVELENGMRITGQLKIPQPEARHGGRRQGRDRPRGRVQQELRDGVLSGVTLLSIGDQVKPGTYRFHSRFNRAVNFEHRGRLIAVVDEAIGPGPLNIVLRGLGKGGLGNPLPPLRVTARTVWFAEHLCHYSSRHRYDSNLACEAKDLDRLQHNLAALGEALRKAAPPKSLAFLLDGQRRKNFRAGFERAFAEQIQRGVRQVFHGRLLQGIRCLKGCGLGLTPSGDDFIAGLLIGLHLLEKLRRQDFQPIAEAVFRAAQGDNLFANTFLDLARRGLLFGHMKDLILALVSGGEGAVRQAAAKMFAIGESSGADLVTGFLMTVCNLRTHRFAESCSGPPP